MPWIKKLAVLILSAACLFSAASCGRKDAQDKPAYARAVQPVQEYFFSFKEDTRESGGKKIDLNPFRFYTHLGTDYGLMGPAERLITWKRGQVEVDLTGAEWAGMWHSLEGLAREKNRRLDFLNCYPPFILGEYQPRCAGLKVRAGGNGYLKLELKSPGESVLWEAGRMLDSGEKTEELAFDLKPEELREVKLLNWVAEPGARLSIDSLALVLDFPEMPYEKKVFLKSYAKMARCYSEGDGVVKDRANFPAGDFDSVPAGGLFCLATGAAWKMGIVDKEFAVRTLRKVHAVVSRLPKAYGLLPHFIRRYDGEYRIHKDTEYSTVDTALYYHGMLLAAQLLSDTETLAKLEKEVKGIQFGRLRDADGWISHGVKDDGKTKLASIWRDWGGETTLVLLLERMAAGKDARLRMDKSGKVFRGVGFIAEIQSLFYPHFSSEAPDAVSGVDWLSARRELLGEQMKYFGPDTAAGGLGLYGVSAGEGLHGVGYAAEGVMTVPKTTLLHPHYILMSAPLRPSPGETYKLLQVMEANGLFPPWGLVENFTADLTEYLPMTGALNASFECLGAYHLWAVAAGKPDEIYEAAKSNPVTAEAIKAFYPAAQ